jgi:hypothetical protein
VTCPGEDVIVGFFDGETLVKKKQFRKVHPAQMIKIKLKGSEIAAVNALKVEVSGK